MRIGSRPLALLLSGLSSSSSSSSTATYSCAQAFAGSSHYTPSLRSIALTARGTAVAAARHRSGVPQRRRQHHLITFPAARRQYPRTAVTTSRDMSSSSTSGAAPPPVPTQVSGRVALLQFPVSPSKTTNHETASSYIARAAAEGVQLCVLPEIWNGPYATAAFPEFAEVLPDVGATLDNDDNDDDLLRDCPSARLLMELAKEHGMWIVGGSISERRVVVAGGEEEEEEERIYNTCLCISPRGEVVAKHRKVHLFDIDVPGGITFRESDTLSPGDGLTAFDAGEPFGMIGVGICYDIRFPEYALLLCQKHKCNILVYPGAFNLTTGPAHWELLQRGRAVDNQCYVMTAAPARVEDPSKGAEGSEGEEGGGEGTKKKYPHYTSWGHSTVVSPWGDVVATCDEGEAMVVADLDMGKVEEMRGGIPTLRQKRTDLYRISEP